MCGYVDKNVNGMIDISIFKEALEDPEVYRPVHPRDVEEESIYSVEDLVKPLIALFRGAGKTPE